MPAKPSFPVVIEPIHGEEGRYYATSQSEPHRKYIIDALAHRGRSECSCTRWGCVTWPYIRDGWRIPPHARCAHLTAFREYLCTEVLTAWAEQKKK
jgi:hypothetical protein